MNASAPTAAHREASVERLRVVSIQYPRLGHNTYGQLLREAFANSSIIDFRSAWSSDGPAWAQTANRLLARRTSNYLTDRNIDLVRFRSELGQSLLARCCLEQMAVTRRADLMHLNTQALAYLSFDIMRRVPTVITGDLTAVLAARMYHSRYWYWTYAPNILLERTAFRAAAAVVMFSAWGKTSVVRDYGVPSRRVHVIPPGIKTALFAGISVERPLDRPVRILFVGGDFYRKGGPQLAEVFIAKCADLGCELHVVTNAASRVPAHPKIFVYRNVVAYSPEWRRLYEQSDIFALPTRGEAFGLAYIEAMAAGLPVIGTKIGAGAEIVDDGHSGYLIDPDDGRALGERTAMLVGDPSLRRRLGEQGRLRAFRCFDAETPAARLAELFVEVVAEKRRSRHPNVPDDMSA